MPLRAARERRRNEALANAIFSRGRRQSAPSKLKNAPAASFASRVGVNKVRLPPPVQPLLRPLVSLMPPLEQRVSSGAWSNRQSVPSGNIHGEWTHDLHDSLDKRQHNRSASALDARTSHPGPKRAAASQRQSRLASAVEKMDVDQVNVVRNPGAGAMGMSIRGLAGPFVVMGQNFAPGTTAADIESAVTPVGGEMVSCRILKTSPFVMAEMVFVSREGGERVIETFNNKTVGFPSSLAHVDSELSLGRWQTPQGVSESRWPSLVPGEPRQRPGRHRASR